MSHSKDRSQSPAKAWSGRFAGATAELMERFNASISFDHRLLAVDIAASKVYARALVRAGLLTDEEGGQIVQGLARVESELSQADHVFEARLEDIHMAVESRLTELIGPVGGKLHTGRSRNDQVNVDVRLYVRSAIAATTGRIRNLQQVLVHSAEAHLDTVMPGYTHLQQAQPILFAHYALSLFWALDRDAGRLHDAGRRADSMPLGSGALAGSAFALDRQFMAEELGFSGITPNSLDAVSDRDFLLEVLAALSILLTHLSRYCEDLIIWSSAEFGFVELDDAYATGSSMMPQKKNPDSLELVRGKTGRVYGDLVTLLTAMKGLGLSYGKDLQEDKEPVFDAFSTADDCLDVFASAWDTMTVNKERMEAAIDPGTLATELADFLVERGVPFRDGHHVVGAVVRAATEAGQGLTDLRLEDLQRHHAAFDAEALGRLNARASLGRRNLPGGTGPDAVRAQLEEARAILAAQNAGDAAGMTVQA